MRVWAMENIFLLFSTATAGKRSLSTAKSACTHFFFDLLQSHSNWDLKKVWEEAYAIIDKEIDEKYSENDCDCMGTTATTCYIRRVPEGWKVSAANVGDSAALLWTSTHQSFITTMHRPTNESEAARVIAAGGKITGERTKRINGQLVVTRALGDHFMKKNSKGLIGIPFVNEDVIMKSDQNPILVIASDGLWDVVPDSTVTRVVSEHSGSSSQELANELCGLAIKKQSVDNVTCVVVKVKSP